MGEFRRRPRTRSSDHAGNFEECPRQTRADRIDELRDDRLAFALEHAVNGSRGMLEKVAGNERGAVAANEDERRRTQRPRSLRQVNQLGNVRQIVARECNNIGPPFFELSEKLGMTLHLEIE